jgi:hypothetical protein
VTKRLISCPSCCKPLQVGAAVALHDVSCPYCKASLADAEAPKVLAEPAKPAPALPWPSRFTLLGMMLFFGGIIFLLNGCAMDTRSPGTSVQSVGLMHEQLLRVLVGLASASTGLLVWVLSWYLECLRAAKK